MRRFIVTQFQERVYEATQRIPRGKVATYAAIARAIGKPKAMRAVGNALNKNPYAPSVPCHRVVRSDLSIGGFARGARAKVKLLHKEGVSIQDGKASSKHVYSHYSLIRTNKRIVGSR